MSHKIEHIPSDKCVKQLKCTFDPDLVKLVIPLLKPYTKTILVSMHNNIRAFKSFQVVSIQQKIARFDSLNYKITGFSMHLNADPLLEYYQELGQTKTPFTAIQCAQLLWCVVLYQPHGITAWIGQESKMKRERETPSWVLIKYTFSHVWSTHLWFVFTH